MTDIVEELGDDNAPTYPSDRYAGFLTPNDPMGIGARDLRLFERLI